jgi:hypothetical protein
MDAQDRFVSRPARPIAFGVTTAVALVVAVLTLVLVSVALYNASTSATSPHAAVLSSAPHNQLAPDARELNDYYYQALADRYRNMAPDAREHHQPAPDLANP